MPTINMDNKSTREYLRSTLRNEAEPLWFPQLAELVAQVAWDRLQREIGLTPDLYSTTRLLRGDPKADHNIAARCRPKSRQEGVGSSGEIPVEILTTEVVRQITDGDVRLLDTHSIAGTVAHQLTEALSLLDLVPTVWPTVCQLVRALHVIDPGDNDTDVSFSDPSVPFSVFVSVPPTRSGISTLRLAEAILHESMHLHLTLVANVVPLVKPQRKVYYSPWRDEERDSEGILQALYVFGVIRSFFSLAPQWKSAQVDRYVADRKVQIDSQIEQVQLFRECEELTPDGAALVAKLLESPG